MKSFFLMSFLMFSWAMIVFSSPWNEYMTKYKLKLKFKNKQDENRRYLKFLESLKQINNINEDYKQGKS